MVDVFISYSREDGARAQDLARRLEARGLSAWWDRQIPPGKTWDQVIGKALEEARSVVVLWTSTSVESDWVKEEASRGSRRGVLVPAVFDHVEPPLGFGRIEAAELSDWDGADDDPELINFLAAVQGLVGDAPMREATRPAAPSCTRTASRDVHESGRRRGLLIGVVAVALVVGGFGILWWFSLEVSHRVDLQIWNVEGEDKGSLVGSHSFSGAARGPMPGALIAQAGTWIAETLALGESRGEVSVQVSVPANLETGEVSLRPSPPLALETHLYIIRDTGKVRVRSDLNRESLAMLDGEFVIELSAVGYSSVPVRARTGQPVEKTVRLRPIRVKLAVEAVSGPKNDIARSLTAVLSEHGRIEVFGPQALERLREEIAESRAAIGVNRTAQMAIRDSLGVDYIVVGVYAR
jgi:hypothetical protein